MDTMEKDMGEIEESNGAQTSDDQADALSFTSLFKRGPSSKPTSQPKDQRTSQSSIPVEKIDYDQVFQYEYNMNYRQRGMAIIINNRKFDDMKERCGTDEDARQLCKMLQFLDFGVQVHHNQTSSNIMKIVHEAAKQDHWDSDCFLFAILSHGDNGIVYTTDDKIRLDTLIDPFKGNSCKSLIGKPKIFIIQACRGDKMDRGVEMSDAESEMEVPRQRIPSEADVIMAFSTVPGYMSWRNKTNGSWFIQCLCKVIEQHGREKQLWWILTRTSYLVAYKFESSVDEAAMNKKKQMPCVISTLTKELYFRPKELLSAPIS